MNEALRQVFIKHLYIISDCFHKVQAGTPESAVQGTYDTSSAWLMRFVHASSVEDVYEAFCDQEVLLLSPAHTAIQHTSPQFTQALLTKIQGKLNSASAKGWKKFVERLVETLKPQKVGEAKAEKPIPSWAMHKQEEYEDLKRILAGNVIAIIESKETPAAEQASLLADSKPITSYFIFEFNGVITFRPTGNYRIVRDSFLKTTISFEHAGDRFIKNRFLYVLDKKPDSFEAYKNGYVLCKDSLEVYYVDSRDQEPLLISFLSCFGKGKQKTLIEWNNFIHHVVRKQHAHVSVLQRQGYSYQQACIAVIEEGTANGPFPLSVESVDYITEAIEYSLNEDTDRQGLLFTPREEIIEEAVNENVREGIAAAFRAIWEKGGSIAITTPWRSRSILTATLKAAGLTPDEIIKIIVSKNASALIDVPMVCYSADKEMLERTESNTPRGIRFVGRFVPALEWPEDPAASIVINNQRKAELSKFWVALKENPEACLPPPTFRYSILNYFFNEHPTRTLLSVLFGALLVTLCFTPGGVGILAFLGLMSFSVYAQAAMVFIGGVLASHLFFVLGEKAELGVMYRQALGWLEECVRGLLFTVLIVIPSTLAWLFSNYAIGFCKNALHAFTTGRVWAGLASGVLMILSGAVASPFIAALAVVMCVFYGIGGVLQGIGKYMGYVAAWPILNVGKEESPYTIGTLKELWRGILAILLSPFFMLRKIGRIFTDLAKGIFEMGQKFISGIEWKKSISDNFKNTTVFPVEKLAPWEKDIALKKAAAVRAQQSDAVEKNEDSLMRFVERHGLWEAPYDMAKSTVSGDIVSFGKGPSI